jgi:hypothetical protein
MSYQLLLITAGSANGSQGTNILSRDAQPGVSRNNLKFPD